MLRQGRFHHRREYLHRWRNDTPDDLPRGQRVEVVANGMMMEEKRQCRIMCGTETKCSDLTTQTESRNSWSFPHRRAQPPLFLVYRDVEVVEADIRQMEPYFFRRVGVHTLDHALPFGIHFAAAV